MIYAGKVGTLGRVGCGSNPKKLKRLIITKPGVYENYLIDGEFSNKILVQIKANNVILRNCEIRNSTKDAIDVSGKNVRIENCKIHHLLSGTFSKQEDAHGITGCPFNLTIRNCEIYYVSGDAIQFCPSRIPWNNVLVENCYLWTGPLPSKAAGFKMGQIPGENAVDTKQSSKYARSKIILRDCLAKGWGGGQIKLGSAFNIKNKVECIIEGCVFINNDVCLRLRGPGAHGGAHVTVKQCAVFQSKVGVRIEDKIVKLKIYKLGIGQGIIKKYVIAEGVGSDYINKGEHKAPTYLRSILTYGVGKKSRGSSGNDSMAKPTDPPAKIIKFLKKIPGLGGTSQDVKPFLNHENARVSLEAIAALIAIDLDEGLKVFLGKSKEIKKIPVSIIKIIKMNKKKLIPFLIKFLHSKESAARNLAAKILNQLVYPVPIKYESLKWKDGSKEDLKKMVGKWERWLKKQTK